MFSILNINHHILGQIETRRIKSQSTTFKTSIDGMESSNGGSALYILIKILIVNPAKICKRNNIVRKNLLSSFSKILI